MINRWWGIPSDFLADTPQYNVKEHLKYVQSLWKAYPYRDESHAASTAADLVTEDLFVVGEDLAACLAGILWEDVYITQPTLEYRPYLTDVQKRLTLDTKPAFDAIGTFCRELAQGLSDAEGAFALPLSEFVAAPAFVGRIYALFHSTTVDGDPCFPKLRDQLWENVVIASGHNPKTYDGKRPVILPHEMDAPDEVIFAKYLANTPFMHLCNSPIPFAIPHQKYTEHAAVFAPTGHGKTRLLEHLIVDFLSSDDPPALFIMDSMGALLRKIERLELFAPERGRLSDKLVVLDPTDLTPPALNFFRLKGGSKAQQTSLYFYLFKAIEQGLTQRQATMVAYLAELMQVIPGATLDTLRQVCESRELKHEGHIGKLDPIAQDFFRNQFYGKDPLVNQTKQQIAQRLYTVGRNDAFNRMFNAPDNRFDAAECMEAGKIVLINTDRLFLGDEASAIFGRFVIAQCLAAALARARIPESQRRLSLLVIDEAKAYLDDQAEMILSDARQFGLGMVIATQAPHQLEDGVQRELATNTSIKMVGPVAYSVASTLARDMHTTPDFIMGMQKRDFEYAEFATYIRGLTPNALRLRVPFDTLADQPTMSEEELGRVRARNRLLLGAHHNVTPAPHAPQTKPSPPDDHTKAREEY